MNKKSAYGQKVTQLQRGESQLPGQRWLSLLLCICIIGPEWLRFLTENELYTTETQEIAENYEMRMDWNKWTVTGSSALQMQPWRIKDATPVHIL